MIGLAPFPGDAAKARHEGQHQERRQRGQRLVAPAPHRGARQGSDRPGQDRCSLQPAIEVFGERQRTGIAAVRLFLQALEADDFQVARHLRVEARRRLGRTGAHLVERIDQGGAGKRRPAREQGIEDRAQAIDVGRRRQRTSWPRSPARATCMRACPPVRPTASDRRRP